MFKLRSRIAVTRPADEQLAVQSNLARRLLFGSLALLLVVSFIVGVDWDDDFVGGMVAGTIFYFVITAICLGVAGWNSVVLFDRAEGEARFIKRLFGVQLSRSALALSNVRAVVIQGIRFLKESEQPRSGLFGSRFRGQMERRNTYYKLQLEGEEKLHLVEDSTDLGDLEAAGKAIADFLGITYRREEL
jgi:hypothetical protein